jgi:hypothetical protein
MFSRGDEDSKCKEDERFDNVFTLQLPRNLSLNKIGVLPHRELFVAGHKYGRLCRMPQIVIIITE